MTVYVDDMNLQADVPNGDRVVRGRWSHLMADSEAELREFAERLGLRPEWIQHPGDSRVHFDVTASKRAQAIRLGAKAITWREAGEMAAARERCGDIGCLDHSSDADRPEHQRPAEGRVRHSWAEGTHEAQRACRHCGMGAEQRWNPVTDRPVVIYNQAGRRLVTERVPPCGSELPDSGLSTEEARHLAETADRQAGEAFLAADYDRAFRLLTDARVLDSAGYRTWNQHERQLRERVRAQKEKPSKPERDDAQIQREAQGWALWNQSVFDRQREASLNAHEGGGIPRR